MDGDLYAPGGRPEKRLLFAAELCRDFRRRRAYRPFPHHWGGFGAEQRRDPLLQLRARPRYAPLRRSLSVSPMRRLRRKDRRRSQLHSRPADPAKLEARRLRFQTLF